MRTTADEGLSSADDRPILQRALETGRVVVTQDRDFGRLALAEGRPFLGIVYLRPGSLSPAAVVRSLALVEPRLVGVVPPFIAVVDHRSGTARLRIRSLRRKE